MAAVRVTLTDDAKADVAALPSPRLKEVAFQWMQRLQRKSNLGAPLDWRPGQDLRLAFKIYFARPEHVFPLQRL